ncbi:hypothetical protein G647_05069 [Cladophialophora carrionii CBS 160.54]|uniref:Uncharacterized protein n=1 Tax=Cladophialophora carrionii CBS 160.54 TaxID=1279043 RepID=V9D8U7_9EURO|nr:uncharacterized protein G647_05069 [Cladophialophora carrionii CBS 160.54]ETI23270.1 hypothetical protein G647_05069 [Cladophialophora carrionii CBS 160.54]
MTTEGRLKSQISANIFVHAGSTSRPGGQRTDHERNVRRISSPAETEGEVKVCTTAGRSRSKARSKSKARLKLTRKLVFFITGNPGLVAYYRAFLSLVVRDLEQMGWTDVVVLVGMSLGGFDVQRTTPSTHGNGIGTHGTSDSDSDGEGKRTGMKKRGPGGAASSYSESGPDSDPVSHANGHDSEEQRLLYPPTFKRGNVKFFTLRDQVELSYARVEDLVDRMRMRQEQEQDGEPGRMQQNQDGDPVEVVLMGHSVGAYICLELVRLWHERHPRDGMPLRHTAGQDLQTSSNAPAKPMLSSRSASAPPWSPSACILLTPTIQDIHLSPSGLIATPLLTNLPFLPNLAQILVHSVLLRLVPASWFASLVSRLTGMQPGSHGLEATLAFLRSERGVEQALHMASWEMKEIRQNRWGKEVWGASHVATPVVAAEEELCPSPNLFFWFTKDDHWVAETTREAIIGSQAPGTVVRRRHVAGSAETAEADEMAVQVNGTKETSRPKDNLTIRVLESEGLLHAWCLDQSEIVAKGVRQWLEELWTDEA